MRCWQASWALPAQAEEALFVQATSLNLRAEPRAKANVVTQLSIGAQCQALAEQKGGWVQLSCDGATGWTQRELLGPTRGATCRCGCSTPRR